MPLIDDLLLQAQRDLAQREALIVRQLLANYGIALARIQRELRTLDAQIAELIASDADISEQYIRRQRWFRDVEASIQREMQRWGDNAAQALTAAQSGGVTVGVGVASEIATAAGSPLQGRVYAEAFERWVSAIQPDSPLRTISLPRYETDIRASLLKRMTEGIGSGKAPRNIVREILRDVGLDPESPVRGRLLTLARTETMRAFRGASADTMGPLQEQGIVTSYVWLARLDSRTCPACVARHGTRTTVYPTDQHPNCRCTARPVADPALVPGGGWHGETGPEWFAKQPEDVQRRILISDERYAAYKTGTPLSQMVTVRHSEIWGDSIGVKPLAAMPRVAPEVLDRYRAKPRTMTDATPTTVMAAD